jgi:TPR repeat protein
MKDRTNVKEALEQAIRDGNLSAVFLLARIYDEGWGVQKNARMATRLYMKAATGGIEEAFYFVGTAYAYGTGVKRDEKRAFTWFRKAARTYSREGAYMEALYLLDGIGCRKRPKLGLRLLLREARRGSAFAMDYLADMYWKRGQPRLARRWAEKAVKGGDEAAAIRLRYWAGETRDRSRGTAGGARDLAVRQVSRRRA